MHNNKSYSIIEYFGIYIYEINVVCCVGRVEIQIEIQKGRCTANTDSIWSIVSSIGPSSERNRK